MLSIFDFFGKVDQLIFCLKLESRTKAQVLSHNRTTSYQSDRYFYILPKGKKGPRTPELSRMNNECTIVHLHLNNEISKHEIVLCRVFGTAQHFLHEEKFFKVSPSFFRRLHTKREIPNSLENELS